MMNTSIKNGLLTAAAAGAMLFGAVTTASAVSLPPGTGVEFKFAGVSTEQNTDGNENTWVVGNVNAITDGFSNLWTPSASESLTFIMYGISDISIIPDGTDFDIYSAGSTTGSGDGKIHIDVYRDTAPLSLSDLSGGPAARTGFGTYPTITDDSLWLALELVPGIVLDDLSTVIDEGALATLFQNANSTTSPATGDGQFYADVVGGSAAAIFDTDGETTLLGTADMFGQFTFTPNDNTNTFGCVGGVVPTCWENVVNDPIRAKTIAEPATLSLLGLGLIGLAGLSRRRRKLAA